MVKFAEKLINVLNHHSDERWKQYYLDYHQLKDILNQYEIYHNNNNNNNKNQQQLQQLQQSRSQQQLYNNNEFHISNSILVDPSKQPQPQQSQQKPQSQSSQSERRKKAVSWDNLASALTSINLKPSTSNSTFLYHHDDDDDPHNHLMMDSSCSVWNDDSTVLLRSPPYDTNFQMQKRYSGIDPTTIQFIQVLNEQLQKIIFFVVQEQGMIVSKLSMLRIQLNQLLHITKEQQHEQQQVQQQSGSSDDDLMNEESMKYDSVRNDIMKEQIQQCETDCYHIAKNILMLIQFIEINIMGIRKIIKKHDKIISKHKISNLYLKKRKNIIMGQQEQQQDIMMMNHHDHDSYDDNKSFTSHRNTNDKNTILFHITKYGNQLVQPLLQDDTLTTMIVSLQADVITIKQLKYHYYYYLSDTTNDDATAAAEAEDTKQHSSFLSNHKRNLTTGNLLQLEYPKQQQSSSSSSRHHHSRSMYQPQSSSTGSRTWLGQKNRYYYSNNNNKNKKYHQLFKLTKNQPEYVLLQIQAAQRRLVQSNHFISLLTASFDIRYQNDNDDDDNDEHMKRIRGSDDEEDEDDDEEQVNFDIGFRKSSSSSTTVRTPKQKVSDILNLLSTFLFLTNYYIVAPTSSSYAMKLGGNASLASMIIGMTPVAALVSTVLYSWWTSYSYKYALIFASTCSLLGNMLYALGLPMNSIVLVMLGRTLNGFGSARSINRRYIADVFHKDQRTAAAAIFVTAGAMGMAFGPAAASVLHYMTRNSTNMYWQSENSPGTFMFVLWFLYLIFMITFFEDPKQQQQKQKSTSSSSLSHSKKIKQMNGDSIIMNEKTPLISTCTSTNPTPSNITTTVPTFVHINKKVAAPIGIDEVVDVPIWKNIPAMMTFFIYFVLKLCLEAVLSSTSVLTGYYFGWDGTMIGIYLAVLGLLMLPANVFVAHLALSYDDRELIMGMIIGMVVGCVVTIQYTTTYSLIQYMLGSVLLFVSATALEGPNMSLLSKTIPKSWSKGIFNIGLLATEAGTFGRVVADILLTTIGSSRQFGGLDQLLNYTFGTFIGITSLCLGLMYHFYDYMEPVDYDDD